MIRHFAALFAVVLLATVTLSAADVLVDFDATGLPTGPLSESANRGSLGGMLTCASPLRVENVAGRAAIVFDGTQQLIGDAVFPAGFEKTNALTVEVWALNPSVEKAETLVALAPARGGQGTEFNFSSGASAGAFRSGFKATTPFADLPSANAWHHLAWSYGEGALRVYVDGELDVEKSLRATVPPQAKVHIGASGEVDNKGPKRGFSGAIARVRIHDAALTQAELRLSAGLRNAFAPSPRSGTTVDSLSVPLRWRPGAEDAESYIVYAGFDRAAVERGERALAKTVTRTESEPVALQLGRPFFWRVDQLGKGGRVERGVTWTFTTDAGLANAPQPRNNDSNVAPAQTQLAWQPGKYATRQRVFFATGEEELARATKPAFELANNVSRCAIPLKLAPGTRYAWRVDSDNGAQPPSHGTVWTFRTQDAPVKNDVTFFVSSDTHYGRENNAAINRRVIDEMNALPGAPLPASIGGGFVRTPRGVVLNGDLLDEGFNQETAPAIWTEFCHDYGLTGTDGRLCFPLYEGFGNHDGGPTKSITRAGIKERNPKRVGLTAISPDGHHYSWDWDHVHLVQLNLFGGSSPADVKGVNGTEHDPEGALDFLRDDLAKNVGKSGRCVIVFQHFGWLGGMADWWQPEAKERFYEVVKPYNIACLINGHSHGAEFIPWHDLLTIHDGSTARGESDAGDFMVVRVTDSELTVVQRKLGAWGISRRKLLTPPAQPANTVAP